MKPTKWALWAACAVLVIAAVMGAAAAAGNQGSQSNPLVTLSYLNEIVVPDILKQVDEKLDARTEELQAAQTAFAAVELPAGRSVTLSAGTQLLVRSGKLASANALVDMTDGTTWNSDGNGMKANHLYLATGDGQRVTAATAVTLMVQGSYTVEN